MKRMLFRKNKISEELVKKIREAAAGFEVVVASNIEAALKAVKGVEVMAGEVENELIKAGDNLKWVHVWSAGVDNYDLSYMKDKGIILTNSSGVHSIQIPEYILGVMLELVKGLHVFRDQQSKKLWEKRHTDELYKKTLGVLGIGDIGRRTAELGKTMGMRVLGYRRSGKPDECVDVMYSEGQLDDMLPLCDFVVNTLPLTDSTYHLIGAAQFDAMKDGAYFINIGRGKVVDEGALIQALKSGKLKGAALDVFEEEPLPQDSPLWDMKNVIITPHISGLSPNYDERAVSILVENIRRYVNGQPLMNQVSYERGY